MSTFSFTVQSRMEWLVVPKEPLWRKARFVTIRMDGPFASLADLPSVYREPPMSIINGRRLAKDKAQMSLQRYDDDYVSVRSLLKEAYEEYPDIYKDVAKAAHGYVWGSSVKGNVLTEHFYTVADGELFSGTRTEECDEQRRRAHRVESSSRSQHRGDRLPDL